MALLATPISALAQPPAASASTTPEASMSCDEAVRAWTERAAKRSGLAITARACPSGLIRFEVAGAGCDFEVRRDGGFKRTLDDTFGVSPIADIKWEHAPEPMKKALGGLLSALATDPSLPIPTGAIRLRTAATTEGQTAGGVPARWRRPRTILAGAGVIVALGATAFGLRHRRRRRTSGAPTA